MFGLFRNTKKEQPSSGPFGVTIGEQAVGSKIIGAPASFPYPYGPHGELFDEEYRHSFHRINPPEFHQLFHSFYGRYVNPFGNGRSTGLSRVIACSVEFDERETNCVLEFFRFTERLEAKYGKCHVVDKRADILNADSFADKKIPDSIWLKIVDSEPRQAYLASWNLMSLNNRIDEVNLSLYVKSILGLKNIRYDQSYLALEYIFSNDRDADEIYQEALRYRGQKDDGVL